jgi:hypothetical protein
VGKAQGFLSTHILQLRGTIKEENIHTPKGNGNRWSSVALCLRDSYNESQQDALFLKFI